jgi:hypothetical protein
MIAARASVSVEADLAQFAAATATLLFGLQDYHRSSFSNQRGRHRMVEWSIISKSIPSAAHQIGATNSLTLHHHLIPRWFRKASGVRTGD